MENNQTKITDNSETMIKGIILNDKIQQEELYEYILEDREDLINNLIMWIGEGRNKDRDLMVDDLKYLLNLDDDYVFSSISTNEYIAKSDSFKEFDNICNDLIKINEGIIKNE